MLKRFPSSLMVWNLVLAASALAGCTFQQGQTSSVPATNSTPLPSISPPPSPISPSPSPIPAGDPFKRAVDKAAGAKTLAQSAQGSEDWQLVVRQWQQAIGLLRAVPTSNPSHKAAQKLLPQYQQELAQAQRRADIPTPPAATTRRSTGASGIPLVAGEGTGSSPTASKDAQDPAQLLATLNQQQLEFYSKQKRFAANLAELNSTVPADMPDYVMNTSAVGANQSLSTATAKQDGKLSYVAIAAVNKDADGKEVQLTVVCASKQPAKSPPGIPTLTNGQLTCPADATAV